MSYIARPTQVLREYLLQQHDLKPRMEFNLGRLSMALEVMTVIKTLEDELVPMLALQRAEIISVLETLLNEQGLTDQATRWYEALSLWRLPTFVAERPDALHEHIDWPSLPRDDDSVSLGGGLEAALALADSTRALPDERQSPALPSGESEQEAASEVESTQNEESLSPDESDPGPVEFLRQSRSRRRIGPGRNHDLT